LLGPDESADLNFGDGWEYVTVTRYLRMRRVPRRHGAQHQYLLKKGVVPVTDRLLSPSGSSTLQELR
jgi:hypothetical protein